MKTLCFLLVLATLGAWASIAQGVELISKTRLGPNASVSAAGASQQPRISRDGQVVVFTSTADNLVEGCHNGLVTDIFAFDRTTRTIELLSRAADATNGGNADSDSVSISSNGRFVVFVSRADNLVPGDTNALPDVFVHDRQQRTTTLVSLNRQGSGSANGTSLNPTITADGSKVAFESDASDLVDGDANQLKDIFLRDLVSGQTTLLTVAPGGEGALGGPSKWPILNADGRKVAFVSGATNLVQTFQSDIPQLYVLDRVAGSKFRLELPMNPDSPIPARIPPSPNGFWTADGRTLLVAVRAVNRAYRIRFNADGSAVESIRLSGTLKYGHLGGWTMNQDGSWVVLSQADLLQFWPADGVQSFLTPATTTDPESAIRGWWPQLDASGRRLGFVSDSITLDPRSTDGRPWLYLGELATRTFRSVAPLSATQDRSAPPEAFQLSDDGQWMAFESAATDVVPFDRNGENDIFLANIESGTVELVSRRRPELAPATAAGSSRVGPGGVSADGRVCVFTSQAGDLVEGDTNEQLDVFVRDLVSGTTELVSVDSSGLASGSDYSYNPTLSANGRFVAFISRATNLVDGDAAAFHPKLFLRDLANRTTRLVAENVLRVARPQLDSEGLRLLFHASTNPPTLKIYHRETRQTTVVSTNFLGSLPLEISADGSTVTYYNSTGAQRGFVARDLEKGTSRITQINAFQKIGRFMTSEDRKRITFEAQPSGAPQQVYWSEIGSPPALLSVAVNGVTLGNGVSFEPAISANGQFAAFTSEAKNLTADSWLPFSQIYVRDLKNGLTKLVSVNLSGEKPANGASRSPVISADGRLVCFQSRADDLVADDDNGSADWFIHDLATSVTRLLVRIPSTLSPASNPPRLMWLSRDASRLVFESFDTQLATPDLNFASDSFTLPLTPDTDADGIDDDWEMLYLKSLAGGPTEDPDRDGVTNLQEYGTNTDPLNGESKLAMQATPASNVTVRLEWVGAVGRRYLVESTTELSAPVWQPQGNARAGNGERIRQMIEPSDGGKQWFRIRVTH